MLVSLQRKILKNSTLFQPVFRLQYVHKLIASCCWLM